MAKIRYKEPSQNYLKNYTKKEGMSVRASVGNDSYVGEYYNFSIDLLVPYHKQARKIFNEGEIDQLAETIKENGIQNPLLVIPCQKENGKFEVVSGERRLRAAKKLGLEKLPCLIVGVDAAEEIALVDNIQRSDLHPIEIANAVSSLLEKPKWGDVTKLSEKIGKSQKAVSMYLSYARLPEKIKNLLIAKNLKSRDLLRKITRLKSQEEMEIFLNNGEKSLSKSILRISIDGETFKIQDSSLYDLDKKLLVLAKGFLVQIIEKIDEILIK